MAKREIKHGCPPGKGTVKPEHGGQIGTPEHVWSQEIADRVREFAELCNQEETARRAGIGLSTLKRHYHDAWHEGHQNAIFDTKAMLLKQVREEKSTNAARLVLAMAGELKHKVEHTGPNGGPIRTLDQAVLARLVDGKSEEELAALEQALALVLAATGTAGGPDAGLPDDQPREGGPPTA